MDAEALPYGDNSFDLVITGMSLGLFPDQHKAVREMVRVLRPGGVISLGAHGPEHYWEACDAILRSIHLINVLGYRFEYWPRSESFTRKLLEECDIRDINCSRHIWRNRFKDGAEAYDFFAAISSNFYLEKVPPSARQAESDHIRASFDRRGINIITDDVIFATGRKPG